MAHRVAIYYAPPRGSALEAFGTAWLGRDHQTGASLMQPAVPGLDRERVRALTTSPRHYGFHATIKAPFRLSPDTSVEDLGLALHEFCSKRNPFEARLKIASVGGFIAFVLAGNSAEMRQLEADTVRGFERFRAPLEQDEIDRRGPSGLTERQSRQFFSFGYPYIFEDFQFHMTLSQRLEGSEHEAMLEAARDQAAGIVAEPHLFEGLAIYEQAEPEADFLVTHRSRFLRSAA